MIKKLLLLAFILSSPLLIAQVDIQRTLIKGKIHVPEGDDAEGISVYNISAQKGTITDYEGSFELALGENDRVMISALQYQSFTVVVDKSVIEKMKFNIFLNPAVNQLEEVVIRPYDLSGNIIVDVNKIPTYSIGKDWDLSYGNLEYGYRFEQDAKTAIAGNAAEDALNSRGLKNGADVIAILGGVANLLFPKSKEPNAAHKEESRSMLSNNMQQRFSKQFITANFDIPEEKAVDFLFYVQENGLHKNMLRPENEMELMEFLFKKSKEYRERGK